MLNSSRRLLSELFGKHFLLVLLLVVSPVLVAQVPCPEVVDITGGSPVPGCVEIYQDMDQDGIADDWDPCPYDATNTCEDWSVTFETDVCILDFKLFTINACDDKDCGEFTLGPFTMVVCSPY